MAKCSLSIRLDDPDRIYREGDTIKGVVHVAVDADVTCNALEIRSGWKTHGRGNVSSGDGEVVSAYAGPWMAGQRAEYPFELAVAGWPPTYHGHYLNVDHSIDARAKIPWGIDPKASESYRVRPALAPEDTDVGPKVIQVGGNAGCMVGLVVFFAILALLLVLNVAFMVLASIVVAVGGVWYVVNRVMPRMVLGDVELEIDSARVSPNQTLSGSLSLSPRKSSELNAITVELHGEEHCVSGSGSNRRTHRHELFKQTETLQPATRLHAGQKTRIPFEVSVPETHAYSFDLGDNEIRWSANFRIDIPRWPDWQQKQKLQLVPAADDQLESAETRTLGQEETTSRGNRGDVPGGVTFAETAAHVVASRRDQARIEAIIDAVRGITFPIEAFVERRLLYTGDDDPHVYPNGYAVWARHSDPPLPMVMYVPQEMADDFEQIGRDFWRGQGTVVGWDDEHRRLQVKLMQTPP